MSRIKKIISIVLCICTVFIQCGVVANATNNGIYNITVTERAIRSVDLRNRLEFKTARYFFRKGDTNADGHVTVADARACLRMAARLENTYSVSIRTGDLNDDGKLTPADARLLLRAAARLETISEYTFFNASIGMKYTAAGLKADGDYRWYMTVDKAEGYEVRESEFGFKDTMSDEDAAKLNWTRLDFTPTQKGEYTVTYEYKNDITANAEDSFTVKYICS